MSKKFVVGIIMLGLSLGASAQTFKPRDPTRTLSLIGAVDMSMLSHATFVDQLSKHSAEPIYMLINSPGGSLNVGMTFVDAMRAAKSRGVEFHCAVQIMAASMAFVILNECQHRYAVANARLLFHPVSLRSASRAVQELLVNLKHTQTEERKIMKSLQRSMGMGWRMFHRNYFAETFWQAAILAKVTRRTRWLRIVQAIDGFGPELFRYRRSDGFFGTGGIVQDIVDRYENMQK